MALRGSITPVARLREEIAGGAALMDDAQAQNEMIGDAVTRAREISEQNGAAVAGAAAASARELSTPGARTFELPQAEPVQPISASTPVPHPAVDLSRGPAS